MCDLLINANMPVERCPGNPQCLADRGDVGAALVIEPLRERKRLGIGQLLGTTTEPTSGSSRPQSRMRPLLDQVALELRQRTKDMEDELAAGGGGIDLLGETFEANSPPLQLGDGLDQVLERAAQPIESPDDQGVALPYIRERLIESRSALLGAGHDVSMDRLTPRRGEGILLQIEDLFPGGNAGVSDVHALIVSKRLHHFKYQNDEFKTT